MSAYIPKVGDRVRLQRWSGSVEGLCFHGGEMEHLVGQVHPIEAFSTDGIPIVAGWGWPLSRLTLVEAAP